MDEEGDTSAYVPVNLLDSLQSSRTYTSIRGKPPRPSHVAPPSMSSATKEKREMAKREAAELYEVLNLGMDTPKPRRLEPIARNKEEEDRLTLKLTEKDQEIDALQRQMANLIKENEKLLSQKTQLEKEKAMGSFGVGTKQFEQVQKSFAQQEQLLAGYQKELEKSTINNESLKLKLTKYASVLEKLYGPNYDSDLDIPGNLTLRKNNRHSINPPNVTNTRQSLSIASTSDTPASTETDDEARVSSQSQTQTQTQASSLPTDELMVHLEGVKLMLRGMEQRLIGRDAELCEIEKRAKEGMDKASEDL